ncbi:MAG: aminotransferase class I/II-fold pyridoxal phosphate-dependent enzyme, partial [Planctomycetota bacterium]
MRRATQVIHAGQAPEPVTGAVMPPISLASTYAQASPGRHAGYEYSRTHNPTRFALERMLAHLEGSGLGEEEDRTLGGFAFVSGMAAIGTLLDLLPAGAHVVCMDDVYGGTNRLLRLVRTPSQGLEVTRADLSDPANLEAALRPKTALVWVETPSNPTLKVADLSALATIARAKAPQAILGCDNTFASPINQQPLRHGFDVVMHSTTKYINGHSDCVGGALVTSR